MTFISDNHLNKHGFFEVGEEKFYSKLDAIQYSISTGQQVSWNFNNDIFSRLDWTKEPDVSIQELYYQRAKSIRDKFDYVVVMFSGGADSTTVLDSFFDNNIKPDEIYMQHWADGAGGNDKFMVSEIYKAALPYIESRPELCHGIKITVNDISDFLVECIRDPDLRTRSYRECNNIHNLGQIHVHYDLENRFDRWRRIHEQGKTLCFVWGEAKPHIDFDIDQNKHYFYFEDHYAHAPQPRDQENPNPQVHHEQFYDDPDHPLIKVKQSHLLLKTMKQVHHRSDIFVDKQQSKHDAHTGVQGFKIKDPRGSQCYTYYNGKEVGLDRNSFNCTIYPSWNFLTYHEDKQAGRLIHPAHAWIEKIAPKESRDWYTGYIKTYSCLPEEWRAHRGGLEQGIKRIQVKYYLE